MPELSHPCTSQWHGPTCRSMSPGSIRPSAATAPPFMMEPMYMPPSPRSLLWPTMLIPRKLYFSTQTESGGWGRKKSKQIDWNGSKELTPGYISLAKSALSTHQLGCGWLTIISGYPMGTHLPGTCRETLLKTLLFHIGHWKVTFKKSARETTLKSHVCTWKLGTKSALAGVFSTHIWCSWKVPNWQSCTILSGWRAECMSSRNTNLQRPPTHAPNNVWPLTIPRNKSITPYPGAPAPSLGFSGRT